MNTTKSFVPFKGLFRAVRYQNLTIVVLAQYLTAIFLNGMHLSWQEVITNIDIFLVALSTVMVAAGGYLINDYYDVKIDYVNHPETVVVGNSLSRRVALFLHGGFSTAGVVVGSLASLYIGLVNFISVFALWLYSNHLKRLPFVGNLVIGLLTSIAILLVAIIYPHSTNGIVVYAFFAGFFSMVREIVKDMEDQKGDAQFGCLTLPVLWGIRKTKVFLYVLVAAFFLSFVFLSFQNFTAIWIPFSLTMTLLSGVLVWRIYRADTNRDFHWLSNYCKLILVLGIASMYFV